MRRHRLVESDGPGVDGLPDVGFDDGRATHVVPDFRSGLREPVTVGRIPYGNGAKDQHRSR